MDEKRKEMRRQALCDLMDDPAYVPMKEKELAVLLQVAKEDRAALSEILQELLAEGKLTVTARGKYKGAKRICLSRKTARTALSTWTRCRRRFCRGAGESGGRPRSSAF